MPSFSLRYTPAVCKHIYEFEESETQKFLIAVKTPLSILSKFQNITGPSLISMDKSDFQNMKIDTGWYMEFLRNRQDYLQGRPPNSIGKISIPYSTSPTGFEEVKTKLSATFIIDSVYNIDEKDYSYEAQFTLIFVWSDLDMWVSCQESTDGSQPEKEKCQYAWRPVPRFPNSRGHTIEAIS